MVQEQDWTEAYKEMAAIIRAQIPEVKHIDLWYDQTNYLEEEYPFPVHSVFIDIDSDTIETVGGNVQNMMCTVTLYHVFRTLSQTYDQSTNITTALEFMPVSKKLHKAFQNTSGNNFSPMVRTSNKRIAHQEGYLYIRAQTYDCIITDYSALREYDQTTVNRMHLNNTVPPATPGGGLYDVNL